MTINTTQFEVIFAAKKYNNPLSPLKRALIKGSWMLYVSEMQICLN